MNNKNYPSTMDLYCVDCKSWAKHKYRREMPDNTVMYMCSECGCENCIEKTELSDEEGRLN